MELHIPYGGGILPLNVPTSCLVGVYGPKGGRGEAGPGVLEGALQNPLSERSFSEFMAAKGEILILVNDGTRVTPTPRVLELIHPQLMKSDVDFMVATGNHRPPTPAEQERIFGKFKSAYADRIHAHDAGAESELISLGRTAAGTEIVVNRRAVQADGLLVIGSVEPHYFAGFTGGRKSLIPGVAGRETITQNHRHALKKRAQATRLKENPVHEDMVDASRAFDLGRVFSIQTVLDRERRIVAAASGHIEDSFQALIPDAKQAYCVPIPHKADVVLSVAAHPMDLDLYQAQKAIESGKYALKEGGVLILVSQCPKGLGDRAFFDLLSASREPQEVKERIEGGYVLGYHKAAKIVDLATWGEIWAKTDLPSDQVLAAHMRPVHDLQGAVEAALGRVGEGASLLVLLDASNLMPLVDAPDGIERVEG